MDKQDFFDRLFEAEIKSDELNGIVGMICCNPEFESIECQKYIKSALEGVSSITNGLYNLISELSDDYRNEYNTLYPYEKQEKAEKKYIQEAEELPPCEERKNKNIIEGIYHQLYEEDPHRFEPSEVTEAYNNLYSKCEKLTALAGQTHRVDFCMNEIDEYIQFFSGEEQKAAFKVGFNTAVSLLTEK